MPDASTNWEEPRLRTMSPCTKDADWVRYSGGVIVQAYCDQHRELLGMSVRSCPGFGWERWNEAKFYGVKL